MFMRMKGHNGVSPCRMCKIVGLRVPGSRATTHYVPLDRSCHPDVKNDPKAVQIYDDANLPMRSGTEIIAQGKAVEAAKTTAEAERLAKKYGVKGVPLLSLIKSLSFPQSFPFDFMHIIWENLIKNLILLWTGDFKGRDEGTGEYELAKAIWEAIALRTSSASVRIRQSCSQYCQGSPKCFRRDVVILDSLLGPSFAASSIQEPEVLHSFHRARATLEHLYPIRNR